MLGIPALITLAFPALAGSTESYDLLKFCGASMGDFNGSIGLVPFVLFIIAAVEGRNKQIRGLLVLAGVVLVILFFTPLVSYLYHRFLIVVVFVMTVSAARGVDILLNATQDEWRWIRRVWLGACLAGALLAVGLLIGQVFIAIDGRVCLR